MPPAIFAFIRWNNAVSNCSAVVQFTDAAAGTLPAVTPSFAAARGRGSCGAGRSRRGLRGRGGADTGGRVAVADRLPVRHALLLEPLVERRIHGDQGLLQRHLERLDDGLALLALEPELVHRAAQRTAVTQRVEWILAIPERRQAHRAGDSLGQRNVLGIGGVAQSRRDTLDHRLLFHLVVVDQRQALAAHACRLRRVVAAVQVVFERRVHFLVERGEERAGKRCVAGEHVARRALQRTGQRQVEFERLHRVLGRGLQQRFERPARGLPHVGQRALHGGSGGAGSRCSFGVHDSSRGALASASLWRSVPEGLRPARGVMRSHLPASSGIGLTHRVKRCPGARHQARQSASFCS